MPNEPTWTSLEIVKLVASLVTPIVITLIGYWLNIRFRTQERHYEAEKERERKAQEEIAILDGKSLPNIELTLDCHFLGLRDDKRLITISTTIKNSGNEYLQFENILLRVRGIKDEKFEFLRDKEPVAAFNHEIIKDMNLVPEKWNFIFIRPGVTQTIPLTTLVSAEYTYLLIHVAFEYRPGWPHTAEQVFVVPKTVG